MIEERRRLVKEIQAAQDARAVAEAARRKADEDEKRLQEEMRVLEAKAGDAIAVEEAQLNMLESHEAAHHAPEVLALSPFTWSAEGGVPDDFWVPSLATPWVVADS